MIPISKLVGVISSSIVLCLSLSTATQAGDRMKPDPCADRKGGQPADLTKCDADAREGIDTVKGEVLHVDGNSYLIQRSDGKEVRLLTDTNTQTSGMISQGDRIEAKVQEVENQKHVVRSIRQTK